MTITTHHPRTWRHLGACAGKPDFCTGPHDRITAICGRCPAISDCARLGCDELAAAWQHGDIGDQRIYAGHQLSELVSIGHTSKAQALTLLDMAGGLTKQRREKQP